MENSTSRIHMPEVSEVTVTVDLPAIDAFRYNWELSGFEEIKNGLSDPILSGSSPEKCDISTASLKICQYAKSCGATSMTMYVCSRKCKNSEECRSMRKASICCVRYDNGKVYLRHEFTFANTKMFLEFTEGLANLISE